MRKTRLSRIGLVAILCLSLTLGAVACGREREPRPRAWIDTPLDGSEVAMGVPIIVISHAYAESGVTEVLLSVNGTVYRREPPPEAGASFVATTQEWYPEEPGEYVLQVEAFDGEGNESVPSSVRVRVIGEVTVEPTASPTAAFTPPLAGTAAPTDTPISPTNTPVLPTYTPIRPTETPLSPTDTPVPPTDTPPSPTDTPAPPTNTPPSPTDTPEATLSPTPQPDTTPPTITDITESDDPIRPPDCDPDRVIISARITDPAGVARSDLYFRVVRGSEEGAWLWVSMSSMGNDTYQAEIGHDQIRNSLFPYEGDDTRLEYYVRTGDTKANMTQSSIQQVTVIFCVP